MRGIIGVVLVECFYVYQLQLFCACDVYTILAWLCVLPCVQLCYIDMYSSLLDCMHVMLRLVHLVMMKGGEDMSD